MNPKAALVIGRARDAGCRITTAESCTGGMIAAALTDIAGASAVFGHGFVSYANDAKTTMLGVPPALIARDGAVSEAVARAMAEGALARAEADLAVAVTGIAGPEGGSAEKPVGTVWFGLARKGGATLAERRVFAGNRGEVRRATVDHGLDLLARELG